MEAGKLADAEMRIRLSIAEHRQGNDLGSLSLARSNLAEILVVEGRWAEAREALEEPRKIAHWRVPVGENLASETLTGPDCMRLRKVSGSKARGARLPRQSSLDEGSMYMKTSVGVGQNRIAKR